jgi:AraC-like DNA-binding protein
MNGIRHIETIGDLNSMLRQEKSRHPLVSIIDFSKIGPHGEETVRLTTGFYAVMIKQNCSGKFKHGRKYYDFQEGTLICIAPNQVVAFESESHSDLVGWGLFFHPDLIRGTALGKKIHQYSFFRYVSEEALHLSDGEKQILLEGIFLIDRELSSHIDRYSQPIAVSAIELLLNQCARFYDRQFVTRSVPNKDIVEKFEDALNDYLNSGATRQEGLPTVKWLADRLFLSPNYLSDLLKKETGKNAQEHIHSRIIEEAKNQLAHSDSTVGEIAYTLGFEYPQYFSKLFKLKTGMTPAAYRNGR